MIRGFAIAVLLAAVPAVRADKPAPDLLPPPLVLETPSRDLTRPPFETGPAPWVDWVSPLSDPSGYAGLDMKFTTTPGRANRLPETTPVQRATKIPEPGAAALLAAGLLPTAALLASRRKLR